jgi:hypothetical protein
MAKSLEPNLLYQRLEDNKAQLQANAEAYLEGFSTTPTSSDLKNQENENLALMMKRAKQLGRLQNRYSGVSAIYSDIIDAIDTVRDNRMGVIRARSAPNMDGSIGVIRDARAATAPNSDSPESYVMTYINLSRAAELLLDQVIAKKAGAAEIEVARAEIRKRAFKAIASLKRGGRILMTSNSLQHLSNELGSLIAGIKNPDGTSILPDGTKALNAAKDFVNFDDRPFHLTTIFTIHDTKNKPRAVIESDVMHLGLTKEIEKEFVLIARSKGETGLAWFDKMPEPKKSLLRVYATKFASGNYVFPTQLADIIGVRNFYSKTVTISEPEGGFRRILSTMHSAAPIFYGKGTREAHTLQNLRLIAQFVSPSGATDKVVLASLNSSHGEAADQSIVSGLRNLAKKRNAKTSLLPVNFFRSISNSDYSQYNALINDIGLVAKALGLEDTGNFLRFGEQKTLGVFKHKEASEDALHELAKITDPRLQKLKLILENTIQTKYLMEWGGDKRNFEIAARMKLIEYDAQHGEIAKAARKHNIVLSHLASSLTFCKSGKDRTGTIEEYTATLAICNALGISLEQKEKVAEVFDIVAKAGQTQELAGRQGGTPGSHGLKGSTKDYIPTWLYRIRDSLFLNTAKFNKLKFYTGFMGLPLHKNATSGADDLLSARIERSKSPSLARAFIQKEETRRTQNKQRGLDGRR